MCARLEKTRKLKNEQDRFKIYCENCGHPTHIYPFEHRDYKICTHCKHVVYKDKQTKFRYKVKELMRVEGYNGERK